MYKLPLPPPSIYCSRVSKISGITETVSPCHDLHTIFRHEGGTHIARDVLHRVRRAPITVNLPSLHEQVNSDALTGEDDLLLAQDAELRDGPVLPGPAAEDGQEIPVG